MSAEEKHRSVAAIDVRLVDVTKQFGPDVTAVDRVSLDVEDGQFFSLLGPSGCGKTTTLRMIGGFEQPTSGLIELQGQDVTWLPPYRRNVNTVFQNYALFPHLTVYENVAFGLRRKKVADREIRQRVGEMLTLVELPGFERRKPNQISGGQAQRVALARALINRPALLLLDEPLGALDLKLRRQMQVELKRIQGEVGITFIYVTHDQEEAMTMSDRIAVMNHGRFEQLGDPEELYERPRTRFVAGFLGISNLLRGRVESRDGEYGVVRTAGGSIRVPRSLVEGADEVEVGIRPEKIRLGSGDDAPTSAANTARAVIADTSYLGVSTQYIAELPDGTRVTVYEQNVARTVRGSLFERGQDVVLTWSPEHSFVVPVGNDGPAEEAPAEDSSVLEDAPAGAAAAATGGSSIAQH
jgi:spermidine/putrescine transport system ATP-binding protein